MKKSTILAIAFFGIMIIVSSVASAQTDSDSPLVTTTGPNVLGQGHIQWNNSLDYHHSTIKPISTYDKTNLNSFGGTTGLRFGVGDRAELTLDFSGVYNTFDTTYYHNTTGFTPAVGAKLLLYKGKGWLPMTSFFTKVALPIQQNAWNGNWGSQVQPEIGFLFRNRLGHSWLLDYSLGYSWNSVSSALADPASLFQYSLYLHNLIGNRHTFGIGIDNTNSMHRFEGCLDSRWQLNDNLQLTARFGLAAGIDKSDKGILGNIDALFGISWMIR